MKHKEGVWGVIMGDTSTDLEAQVTRLAARGSYDYFLIDCSGMVAPLEVAEALAGRAGEEAARLHQWARLDTIVTVVDASKLLHNLASLETLTEGEASRGVAELLAEQVECADVLLLNKVDLVSEQEQQQLLRLLHTLNPRAHILPSKQAQVPVPQLFSGRFNLEKLERGAGWLKALQDGFPPEGQEYGMVYRARRPFHPQRLHAFLTKHFLLQEPGWGQAGGPKQDNLAHSHHENCSGHHHPHSPAGAGSVHQTLLQASEQSQQAAAALQSMVQEVVGSEGATRSVQEQALLATVAAAASAAAAAASAAGLLLSQQQHGVGGAGAGVAAGPAHRDCDEQGAASSAEPQQRQQLLTDSYGHLLRSKGFVWLASRPNLCGEWTQAGGTLRLGVGGPWYAALPTEAWPQDEQHQAAALRDFQEPHGDRRQELVLMGLGLQCGALTAALDACLCSDAEMAAAAAGQLVDPFAAWPSLEEMLVQGDGGEEGDEVEEEGEEEGQEEQQQQQQGQQDEDIAEDLATVPCPPPGIVHSITAGAAELQQCFDSLAEQAAAGGARGHALGVVGWHANWLEPSHAASKQLDQLARRFPATAFFTVDVASSSANIVVALERVMKRAETRRKDCKPTLKGGLKWPCITVHLLPSLQQIDTLSGTTATQQLLQLLTKHTKHPAKRVAVSAPTPAATPPAHPAAPTRVAASVASPAVADASSPPAAKPATPPSSSSSGGSVAASASAPAGTLEASRMVVVSRGAAELKEMLAAGRASGHPVLVLWTRSDSSSDAAMAGSLRAAAADAAAATCGLVLADADVAASKANELLAQALKVGLGPQVDVYSDMKLAKRLSGSSLTPASLLSLAAELGGGGGAASSSPLPPPPAKAADAPAASPAQRPAAPGQQAALPRGPFDPPEPKFAKSGATKPFPDGLGYLFPKMPCLRCGCPWWSSEEWNARCMRCGWDCESAGYDNDSQPLPRYKAKWEQFVAAIRAGRTPAWSGKAKQ
ncbi:hypothetical protein D9Q98_008068 [Chlorella vulgaris]|uniref:CobW C-terminal domain-containing protein n=1 Tax=Chlorella vulgaris TaxID=3077 RepID=A0A9D4TI83_CHLVU|nr:hypothetical protein D9Q98_008068 [Chlorella vulgaris]